MFLLLCVLTLTFAKTASQNAAQCIGPCSSQPDQVALCPTAFTCQNGTCCMDIQSGSCTSNADCASQLNKECQFGFCRCKQGFIETFNSFPSVCKKLPLLGEKCSFDDIGCATENSNCTKGKCTCLPGFKAESNKCVRDRRQLNSACKANEECQSTFSACSQGKCVCRGGFIRLGAGCVAKESVNCNFGPAPLKGGKPISCTIFYLNGMPADSCSEKAYCVPNDEPLASGNFGGNQTGFCCPKPVLKCPRGSALPSAGQYCDGCPFDSHTCVTDREVNTGVCCPRACYFDEIPLDGNCLARKQLGESCSIDAQCERSNGKCSAGKCACVNGTVEEYGYCFTPYCPFEMNSFSLSLPLFIADGQLQRCAKDLPCPSDFTCNDRFNICCSAVVQAPVEQVCPSGTVNGGSCSGGLCAPGFQCMFSNLQFGTNNTEGVCCQSLQVCSNGAMSLGACVNNLCPTGTTCQNDLCCPNVDHFHSAVCSNGAMSLGSCVNNLCPIGTTCQNDLCCPNVDHFHSAVCSNGAMSLGSCVNNLCPIGTTCQNDLCCPNVDQ